MAEDEEAQNPEEEKPAASEAAPEAVPELPEPVAEAKEEAPVAKEEAPVAKEKAPVAKEAAPVTKEAAPVTKEAAPVTKVAAPVPAPRAAEEKKEGDKREGEKRQGAGKDVFASLGLEADDGAPKILKAKGSKNVHSGIVHVLATFNNTLVTVTDLNGNVIGWSSSGKMGFRGSRKSTAYASQLVSQDACRQAMGHGLRQVEVRVKGPGSGRESAVRAVQAIGIEITSIKDVTPIPHNGCRPPKARRV